MYEFKSLGVETNFLMDSFLASTTTKDNYIVIQTPERPSYFWGNYILFKKPPGNGDFNKWIDIFESEIGKRSETGYCAITFDLGSDETFDVSEFVKNEFRVEVDKILITNKVEMPKKFNSELKVQEYDLITNIDSYIETHFDESWSYGSREEQEQFLKEQALEFSSLISKKCAKRFGGFLNGKLITDLGIYWKDNVVRFNSISTHPSYRRLGACSTLVYTVSKRLLAENPKRKLVMQADEDYHAALIYESIGFVPKERVINLEWKDDSKFGHISK